MDHATIQHWVYKLTPLLYSEMKNRKGRVGTSWKLDETYIKVKGIWCYLYRSVDKLGNTVDFLLTRKRHTLSAQISQIKLKKKVIRSFIDSLKALWQKRHSFHHAIRCINTKKNYKIFFLK